MPLIEIRKSEQTFSDFKMLVEKKEEIISEYESFHDDSSYIDHFMLKNWKLLRIQSIETGKTENASKFKTISEFIDSVPDNIKFLGVVISKIDYGQTAFHQELWTKMNGFHRIHIPILNVDKSFLYIIEGTKNKNVEKYGYELGKMYRFLNPYDPHKPSNEERNKNTRLIILIDYIDTNEESNYNEEELIQMNKTAYKEFTNK